MMNKNMDKNFACLSFALLVFSCAGCDKPPSVPNNLSPEGDLSKQEVTTTEVVSRSLTGKTKLPGELSAYRDISIYPRVPGFVEWIGVDRGSAVSKGQLLIRLSAPEMSDKVEQATATAKALELEEAQSENELSVAKHQASAAHAKAEASSSNYRRLKDASAYPGIIPGNDLEISQKTAEADSASAQALDRKIESLSTQLRAAARRRKAAFHDADSDRRMRSYLRLTAPFSGTITERRVHEGSFVSPPSSEGTPPLLRLKQLSLLRLTVPIPEASVGAVCKGAIVDFTVAAYPDRSFTGTVSRVPDSVEVRTRTMPVELDVENPNGLLAPGMFAEVSWPVQRSIPSLVVPVSAIVTTTERVFVVKVMGDRAEWVDVKPGHSQDGMQEIFGALSPGDQVVLKATDELRDGSQVSARLTSAENRE